MRNNLLFLFLLCFICSGSLQSTEYKETTTALQSFAVHMQLKEQSVLIKVKGLRIFVRNFIMLT